MNLDAAFGLSETGPAVTGEAQTNSGRINEVEFAQFLPDRLKTRFNAYLPD